jgi:hypothetical protein
VRAGFLIAVIFVPSVRRVFVCGLVVFHAFNTILGCDYQYQFCAANSLGNKNLDQYRMNVLQG